jgi:glycosyltransferase involved in cell wall biosynthesis
VVRLMNSSILFISHVNKKSGAETVLLRVMKDFQSRGHNVHMIYPGGGTLENELKTLKVNKFELNIRPIHKSANPFYYLIFFLSAFILSLRIFFYVRKHNIQIIYSNSLYVQFYLLWSALVNIPVIVHIHDLIKNNMINRWIVVLLLSSADRLICISGAVCRALEKLGVDKNLLTVVYNGVDADKYFQRYEACQDISKKEGKRVVAVVGQITSWKDQETFIRAVPEVITKTNNVIFYVVGSPLFGEDDYMEKLYHLSKELNVNDYVVFKGYVQDTTALMKEIDVLVCSSLEEPFGLVIIEAMAAQKVVVGTNAGGIPEIVTNGRNGFLFEPKNHWELSRKIVKFLNDPNLYKEMSEQGYRTTLERFQLTAQLNSIYQLSISLQRR